MTNVHLLAVGARTPMGQTAEASVAAARAGLSQLVDHPFLVDKVAEPIRVARDASLEAALMGPERLIRMGTTALGEVCAQLARMRSLATKIPLYLALPEERPGWTVEDTQAVARGLSARRFGLQFDRVEVVAKGHAAGLMALSAACERIESGTVELCVIVGLDSYLRLETLAWLEHGRQLATSYHRGAFFPGEAAAACAVASESLMRRLGIPSLALVRGVGVTLEPRRIKTDTVVLGEGLTACVKTAIKSLRLPGEMVQGIICDINGERYRSEEWGLTLLRLPAALADPTSYDAPASNWGDVGAASGPLFITIAAIAGKRGWAKGSIYLVWNSSEAGHRAAAVLQLAAPQHASLS
ncbi:MAG: hypothetical protein ABJA98_13695 [Acidobacteriota bacterium]